MTTVRQDLRYAFRSMCRTPGFTLVCILTLTLGIAANVTIFSLLNAVMLRSLPYKDPDRLSLISTDPNDKTAGIALEHYQSWKSSSQCYKDLAIYYRNTGWSRVTLTGNGDFEPELAQGGFVSASLFPTMGVLPMLGRVFDDREEAERDRLVVLSYALWKQRFGSKSDAIGKTIKLNGNIFEIIGVMPPTFQFPASETQLWAPVTTNDHWLEKPVRDDQHNLNFYWRWNAIGRLNPGIGRDAAQNELNSLTSQSQDASLTVQRGIGVFPLRIELSSNVRVSLFLLMGSVSFVLLIACINVSNLLLARGVIRDHEIAVRVALGAQRKRIIRQLLTENLLLALVGGVCGVFSGAIGIRVLSTYVPTNIPRIEQVGIDGPVLAFTFVVSLMTTVISGSYPAWKMSEKASGESAESITSIPMGRARKGRIAGIFVVLEFSLSVILLTGALLLIRSLRKIQDVDPGFHPARVVTMHIIPSVRAAAFNESVFQDELFDRIGNLPGVESVGAVSELFEKDDPSALGLRAVEGHFPESRDHWTSLVWTTVSGDYFSAMGNVLIKGRYFSDHDQVSSPPVAIVDESLAQRYWPGEDAVGKHFKGQDKRGANDDWVTVIGVVANMHRHGLETQVVPHIFEWHKQAVDNPTPNFVVRTTGDPSSLAGMLRSAVHNVQQSVVVSDVANLQVEFDRLLAPRLFQVRLLSMFSAIALLLACVGIYGVMYYSVSQSTNEIGLRMAIGASRTGIVTMFLRRGLRLAALGLALGLLGSFWVMHLLSGMLYNIAIVDPLTIVITSAILLGVAVIATAIPAWQAAKGDPFIALKVG